MTKEKDLNPMSGYLMLFLLLLLAVGGVFMLMRFPPLGIFAILGAVIVVPGFVLVNPNSSRVLLLFGKYVGTIKSNGLFWVNPLYSKKKDISTSKQFR